MSKNKDAIRKPRRKPDPDCPKCGGTGVKEHAIDPKTDQSIRIKCECVKG